MSTGPYTTVTNTKVAAARWRPCRAQCTCPLHATIAVGAATKNELCDTLEMIDAHTLQTLARSQGVPMHMRSLLCAELGYNPEAIHEEPKHANAITAELAGALESLYVAAISAASRVGLLPGFLFECSDGNLKARIDLAGFCIENNQVQA